jgi:hypothetical protein
LKARDALLQQNAGAMVVPVAPVMETDADLEDPVIEATDRRTGVPPEELEGLVLLEELAGVELLNALQQRVRWRVIAPGPDGFVDGTAGDALGRAGGLPVAASGLGRVRRRSASGNGARPG